MEKQRKYALAFSAFIIIILIGSSLIVFLSADNTQQTPPTQPPSTQAPGTALQFESGEFDANIFEMLPYLVLAGQTSETIIGKIDAELASIQGVRGLQSSQYVGNPSQTLTYKAELALQPGSSPASVLLEITQSSKLLGNIQGAGLALLQLPAEIPVINQDLNVSKTYSPTQSVSQAFVSAAGLKGDSIKAVLSVSFTNEVPSNPQVFETSNPALQPSSHFARASAKILALEKTLLAEGSMSFENYLDSESLQQVLESQDFNVGVVQSQEIDRTLTASFAKPEQLDLNALQSALDSAGIPDLNSSSLEENFGEISISAFFNPSASLSSLEAGISKILQDFNVQGESVSFSRPSANFSLSLSLDSENSLQASKDLNSLLSGKGILLQETVQPVSIDLNEIFAEDLNATLLIDSQSIAAFASPGHNVGEEVEFLIGFSVLRGVIQPGAQALEQNS